MSLLFSQEEVLQLHDRSLTRKVLARGRSTEKLDNLRRLMANMGLSAEEAMDVLEIPQDEREKYLRLLNSGK